MLGVIARVVGAAEFTLTRRHHTPDGGTLRAVAAGPKRIVAVGDGGLILSSSDGRTWTRQDSPRDEALRGVAFSAQSGDGPFFIAVGDRGTILRSPDGDHWSEVAVPGVTARLNHVSHYGGRFFVVGEQGTIVTSIDGRRWTICASGVDASLRCSAQVNGSDVIAVGAGGMAVIGRQDGEDWRPLTTGITSDLECIAAAYGAGPLYPTLESLSVGAHGAVLIATNTGAEGRRFVAHAAFNPIHLRGSALGLDSFIIVGDGGSAFLTANNAASSPLANRFETGTAANLHGVAYRRTNDSSSFFAVGDDELILHFERKHHAWLHNLALRAQTGTGDAVLTTGFVIRGVEPKPVLIRAAGPALAGFDVTGALPRPMLTVFDAAGRAIGFNAGWSTNANLAALRVAAGSAGAFAFPEQSADSALLLDLAPGTYTAQVIDRDGAGGLALIELYDPETAAGNRSRLINLSARCVVRSGDSIAIPGITSRGDRAPRLLIRAVGPGLAGFGVAGSLANPRIEVWQPETYTWLHGGGVTMPAHVLVANGAWSQPSTAHPSVVEQFSVGTPDEVRAVMTAAGAFPLDEGSGDAALLLTIDPQRYSIQVRGAEGRVPGIVLIEVYDVSDL